MAKPLSSTILRDAADLIDKDIVKLIRFRASLRSKPADGFDGDNNEDNATNIKAASIELTGLRNEAEKLRDRADRQDLGTPALADEHGAELDPES